MTKARKYRKYKSNWYIYLITFLVTGILLSLVVIALQDSIFPANNNENGKRSVSDFRPDSSYNATYLFMLGEEKGGFPKHYMLLNYRPRDEVIVVVPLRNNTYLGRNTIEEQYRLSGAVGILEAIKSGLNIVCKDYIKFDKQAFIDFVEASGDTSVNIPVEIKDAENNTIFEAGNQRLKGADLYTYINTETNYGGEDYNQIVKGIVISNFINQNIRGLTVGQMQSRFTKIINNSDTEYTLEDFTANQTAYVYTTENSNNIAEYYIPYGELSDESFIIAEMSLTTIQKRFGLEGGL